MRVPYDSDSGSALMICRVTNHEAERGEVDRCHPLAGAWVAAFPAQRRQSVTPFIEQTWQMNVPQP